MKRKKKIENVDLSYTISSLRKAMQDRYGFGGTKICKRCHRETSSFDYKYNGGYCDSCHVKTSIKWGLIAAFITFLITVPFCLIQFQYEIDKCNNLNSAESNYNFSETVEINAQFNEHCYFLNHHPLALASYLESGIMIGAFIGTIMWGFRLIFFKPTISGDDDQ